MVVRDFVKNQVMWQVVLWITHLFTISFVKSLFWIGVPSPHHPCFVKTRVAIRRKPVGGLSHSEVSRFCDDPNVWHPIETIRFAKNRDSIRHKQLSCMDDVFCEECLHHKIAFPTEMLSQKRFAHWKQIFFCSPPWYCTHQPFHHRSSLPGASWLQNSALLVEGRQVRRQTRQRKEN